MPRRGSALGKEQQPQLRRKTVKIHRRRRKLMLPNPDATDSPWVNEPRSRYAARCDNRRVIREPQGQAARVGVLVLCQQPDDPVNVQGMVASEFLVCIVKPVPERHQLHDQIGECLGNEHRSLVLFA